MLLTLRIVAYRNQPVPGAVLVRLSDAGGSIGRGADNAIVLDDPTKYISRVHARVVQRDGAYLLEDVGGNPSVVNDRPLGKGREVMLGHGDRLVIGDYLLQAGLEELYAPPPLPAAPVNNAALPMFEPPAPPAPVQLPAFEPAGVVVAAAAAQAVVPSVMPDSLAGASILNLGPGASFGFDDTDPLGLNLFGAPAPATPLHAADSDHVSPERAALPGLLQPGALLQALPAAKSAPSAAPLPPSLPSASGAGAFAIPHDYDPLADFMAPEVRAAAPPATSPSQLVSGAPLHPLVEPAPLADPQHERTQLAASPLPPIIAAPAPSATPQQTAAAPTPPAFIAPLARLASDSEILQALLRGLGLPELKLQRPAIEVAETIGALLREATAGTMDVLMARALTKKESRIEMTMLSVRANNPLKFFPNAEGALGQMLTGALAGYMHPRDAMASAFDDLRAHELAVIAGMRAALAAVLHRFDPALIESRLAVPTVMDKMLAANRKAKMWDRLVELYGEIAREADDDLQRLFGEKFSEAYEEQVVRLREAKNRSR